MIIYAKVDVDPSKYWIKFKYPSPSYEYVD